LQLFNYVVLISFWGVISLIIYAVVQPAGLPLAAEAAGHHLCY
jgi:hypothetical protein